MKVINKLYKLFLHMLYTFRYGFNNKENECSIFFQIKLINYYAETRYNYR